MSEHLSEEMVRKAACNSLLLATGLCIRCSDGSLRYNGEQPGPGWHVHGYCDKTLWLLEDGEVIRVLLHKRRWLLYGTNKTCHSRPPGDSALVRSSSLIVFLVLWTWLDGGQGLHNRQDVFPDLERCASGRTAQRWLHRSRSMAIEIQQAIRLVLIERCEPRPVEILFPVGLPPPEGLLRRRWDDVESTESLWRALAFALIGSVALSVPLSSLLAEARGRWHGPADSLVI